MGGDHGNSSGVSSRVGAFECLSRVPSHPSGSGIPDIHIPAVQEAEHLAILSAVADLKDKSPVEQLRSLEHGLLPLIRQDAMALPAVLELLVALLTSRVWELEANSRVLALEHELLPAVLTALSLKSKSFGEGAAAWGCMGLHGCGCG